MSTPAAPAYEAIAPNAADSESTEASRARTDAVHALEGEFSELINRFRRLITDNANRVSPGMLPGAYKVFTTIARRESVTQSALAEHLLVDKGQLSRAVRELEQLGLIERSPDPRDGRSSLLSVTALGTQRLAIARSPQENLLLHTLRDWPIDDIRNLSRLLHAVTTGVQPSEGSADAPASPEPLSSESPGC